VFQGVKKIAKRESDREAEEVYTSTWPYFIVLKFIVPSLSERKSTAALISSMNKMNSP